MTDQDGQPKTLAVAGGTGVVGRHVVDVARGRGHHVVVLARALGVDLTTGEGLTECIAGVDTVVDVTNIRTARRRRASEFFGTVIRRLLTAEVDAGVGHHVALSIVGIDRVEYGYYAGKREQEALVAAGPVPWSILRATQFHEFAEQILEETTIGRVSFVPRMIVRPVAAREVAGALIDLVEGGPSGRRPDLAGPEELQLVDLVRRVAESRGPGRRVVGVPLPGAVGRAVRTGALVPTTVEAVGRVAFDDWLAAR